MDVCSGMGEDGEEVYGDGMSVGDVFGLLVWRAVGVACIDIWFMLGDE